ncbi:Glycine oxidase [Posidoniimonas polymericola]|uniref:Glycine oxidase n=1 Tax=Posidoniimonas polymericola TaxID=2528002 RepID=A0A5C5YM26_9BACT|nr:Glycine oxidase [Posidoniimonas polymericola]
MIGAGVVGLSVAEELLSHGLTVTVFDRQRAGREASWAGAGILPPGSRYSSHPAIEELAALSDPLNERLSQRLREFTGLDDGFWRCGALYFAGDDRQHRELAAMYDRWRGRGIAVNVIDQADLADLAPYASDELERFAAEGRAHYVPSESQARNPRRLRALTALCQAWGGRVIEHSEVVEIAESPEQVTLRLADGDRFVAGRVVIANGAWASRFLPQRDGIDWVRPVRGQMLLLSRPESIEPLGMNLHVGPHYLAPRTDGRVLAGATVEEAAFDKSTTAAGCGRLLHFVNQTGLGGLRLEQAWAGLRPATADELPLIGPASERTYVAAGHFRAGLQFASATAMLIREQMLGQPPTMDVSPFRIDR